MSDLVKEYFTHDEAIKALKRMYRPGCTYFVCVNGMIYTQIPTEDAGGSGYPMYAHVEVSQKGALKFVKDIFGRSGRFLEEGCKIKISSSTKKDERGGCIFIG